MISVCILTKNASETLEKCLTSVMDFPEVILLDNGSEDHTLEMAKKYPNVNVHLSPFLGFGPLRNVAASLAKNDWILALDSDEVLSPALRKEIFSLILKEDCVYSFSRHNFFQGKWIKGAGWYPDKVVRLYHKKNTCYSGAQVHESVVTSQSKIVSLRSPIFHTPYRSYSDFLKKNGALFNAFCKTASWEKALLFRQSSYPFVFRLF